MEHRLVFFGDKTEPDRFAILIGGMRHRDAEEVFLARAASRDKDIEIADDHLATVFDINKEIPLSGRRGFSFHGEAGRWRGIGRIQRSERRR